jgi:hypothetical protein
MHEFSQTAGDPIVDWKVLPLHVRRADATPLFLMAVRDYCAPAATSPSQGASRGIEKAWAFETEPAPTPTTTASTTTPRAPAGSKAGRRPAPDAPPGGLSRAARRAGQQRLRDLEARSATPPKRRSQRKARATDSSHHRAGILRPGKRLLRLQPQRRRPQRRDSTAPPPSTPPSRGGIPAPSLAHPDAASSNSPRPPSPPTGGCATSPPPSRSTTA